jgi:hypothetical protein
MNHVYHDQSTQSDSSERVVIYTPYMDIRSSPLPSLATSYPSISPVNTALLDKIRALSQPTKKSNQTHRHHTLSIILQTFLYNDYSHTDPVLQKWVEWSKGRGYVSGRVILSDNSILLLASTKEGGVVVYELPSKQGGHRQPVLRRSFTAHPLDVLKEMWACQNVSGGYTYCKVCPSCQAYSTDQKVFVNKKKEIKRLQGLISEVEELEKHGDRVIQREKSELKSAVRHGWHKKEGRKKAILERLEGWKDDPAQHRMMMEMERDRLMASTKKELKDSALLIQVPHWFISICTPTALHALYDAQDGWLPRRVLEAGRRASPALEGVLKVLVGLEIEKRSFTDVLRLLFRKMVVEVVEAQQPRIELTMEHQLHPFNKWDFAPDVHSLVCRRGKDRSSEMAVDVAFDAEAIRRAVEVKMKAFIEFVIWAIKKWNDGNRSTEFKAWRKAVLEGAKVVLRDGIETAVVEAVQVPMGGLLGTHCYLRRRPMENVQKVYFDTAKGLVTVSYHGGEKAKFGIVDFLWRFVGFDGRGFGVRYGGAYLSTRIAKRGDKIEAVKEGEQAQREVGIENLRGWRGVDVQSASVSEPQSVGVMDRLPEAPESDSAGAGGGKEGRLPTVLKRFQRAARGQCRGNAQRPSAKNMMAYCTKVRSRGV